MSKHEMDSAGREYDIGCYYEKLFFYEENRPKIAFLTGLFIGSTVLTALLWARRSYLAVRAWGALEEYRRTLIDSMAHDLKTPLTAMSGYAENLKENPHPEKLEYYADAILHNVSDMNELIQKDLELSIADSVLTRHGWRHVLKYDRGRKTFECRIFIF